MLYYVGLESYISRYSFQLTEWNTRWLDNHNIKYQVVKPEVQLDTREQIQIGQVLDGAGRPYYAMGQIQTLLKILRSGQISDKDVIFFEDMFHPGIEGLAYLLYQMPKGCRPLIYARCLAQTIDSDDFVHVTGMSSWMRHSERAILEIADGILVASHEMLSNMTVAGWNVRACVTGLPFGLQEVQERAGYVQSEDNWDTRQDQVVFAARTDREKMPRFFLELSRLIKEENASVDFLILSGKPSLTFNDPEDEVAVTKGVEDGLVRVVSNLSKNEYYQILTKSKILFNCALQDWVSNTVSEADALGCNVLYPAYRSFPEVFKSDHTRLYIPWSLIDAKNKLLPMLENRHPKVGEISSYQDLSIERTYKAILNDNGLTGNSRWVHTSDTSYRSLYSLDDVEGSSKFKGKV